MEATCFGFKSHYEANIIRINCINTTSGCIDTVYSPDDEHEVARNM
jgi:hypothetical protein